MKRLFAATVAALLAAAGPALAQDASLNEGVISLSVGRTQLVPFSEPIGEVNFMPKEVADAVPLSNQSLSVVGVKPGVTQMYVFSQNRQLIYSVAIAVASEPGHQVRIYGTNKNADLNAGYTSVYCDDVGCGRPDKDLPSPTAITVDRLSRIGNR